MEDLGGMRAYKTLLVTSPLKTLLTKGKSSNIWRLIKPVRLLGFFWHQMAIWRNNFSR